MRRTICASASPGKRASSGSGLGAVGRAGQEAPAVGPAPERVVAGGAREHVGDARCGRGRLRAGRSPPARGGRSSSRASTPGMRISAKPPALSERPARRDLLGDGHAQARHAAQPDLERGRTAQHRVLAAVHAHSGDARTRVGRRHQRDAVHVARPREADVHAAAVVLEHGVGQPRRCATSPSSAANGRCSGNCGKPGRERRAHVARCRRADGHRLRVGPAIGTGRDARRPRRRLGAGAACGPRSARGATATTARRRLRVGDHHDPAAPRRPPAARPRSTVAGVESGRRCERAEARPGRQAVGRAVHQQAARARSTRTMPRAPRTSLRRTCGSARPVEPRPARNARAPARTRRGAAASDGQRASASAAVAGSRRRCARGRRRCP